jgi:hypothetical protein
MPSLKIFMMEKGERKSCGEECFRRLWRGLVAGTAVG